MQVDALLPDPRARRALRSVLQAPHRSKPRTNLSPWNLQPHLLHSLEKMGFEPLLLVGVDDDKNSLERILAGAVALVLHSRVEERLRNRIADPALDLSLAALAYWTPRLRTAGLAECLGMSAEGLRQLSGELLLPSPREWLCWGRLFFGLGLSLISGRTVSRLAYRLGYGDRSSLCRLSRRLTGREAQEVFGGGGGISPSPWRNAIARPASLDRRPAVWIGGQLPGTSPHRSVTWAPRAAGRGPGAAGRRTLNRQDETKNHDDGRHYRERGGGEVHRRPDLGRGRNPGDQCR